MKVTVGGGGAGNKKSCQEHKERAEVRETPYGRLWKKDEEREYRWM